MGQAYTTVGGFGSNANGGPIPTNVWLHAHVDINPSGAVDLTLGAIHVTTSAAAITSGSSPTMSLELGISGYNQPAPQFAVYYDNVTVDYL